jgi:DNA-binding MarR family transcriptional regulator
MKVLPEEIIEAPLSIDVGNSDVAPLIMDVVPLIMNSIRTEMRSQRMPELTLSQFRTLTFLYRHEDASLSELAEHIGSKLPTMSKTVENLVERKMVIRSDSPQNRRQIRLKLSAAGLKELSRTRASVQAKISVLFVDLSEEQRVAIAASLTSLRTIFSRPT